MEEVRFWSQIMVSTGDFNYPVENAFSEVGQFPPKEGAFPPNVENGASFRLAAPAQVRDRRVHPMKTDPVPNST